VKVEFSNGHAAVISLRVRTSMDWPALERSIRSLPETWGLMLTFHVTVSP
jgi:hypothetical protein